MKRFLIWAQGWALAIGGPGLFAISLIDASVLTLPEANDILIVVMVTRHPGRLAYYALMQALGSMFGSLLWYWLGRKGGEVFLRKRFSADRVERGTRFIRRWGFLGVLVPSLLPPPTPFKLIVVLSGALGMSAWAFSAAVFIGRCIRYGVEGLLAVWYGEAAMDFIRTHSQASGLVLAGLAAAGGLIFALVRHRRHGRQGATSSGTEGSL